MDEIPGIKKYSNDNLFLNNVSDLTRAAYSSNTRDIPEDNKPKNRFETNIILNSRESFDSNNQKLNSLNEEIRSLKNKLKTIYEKEEEIYKLNIKIKELQKEIDDFESFKSEMNKLKIENKNLRDTNDELLIKTMNIQALEQENEFLKIKLKSEELKEGDEKVENKVEENKEDKEENTEKIHINIPQFKSILNNRLKKYHEKHIDDIIDLYKLNSVDRVDKGTMEKILHQVIHI